jgi:hypothetical protein
MGAPQPDRAPVKVSKPTGRYDLESWRKIGTTVAGGVLLAISLFVWNGISGTRADLGAKLTSLERVASDLQTENQLLRSEVRHLRELIEGQMDDRYRGSQAKADLQALDAKSVARDAIQQKEMDALERRLSDLESAVRDLTRKRKD